MYADPKCVKSYEIRVRLDSHDGERLERYIERFGGERAVLGRDALIQLLDQADVQYSDAAKNLLLRERQEVSRLKQTIRDVHGRMCSNDSQQEFELHG